MDKTLIYLTDNCLSEPLATRCREILAKNAQDVPIISVSQKPIELGLNICVGETGRNWLSLYRQQLAGAERAETKYVGICEHDVLYTYDHLSWIPPRDDTFYYNHNCWLVQWGGNHPELNGMYSYYPRRFALSQMVCNRELLIKSLKERLNFLENGYVLQKGLAGAGEPGVKDNIAMAQKIATNGSHRWTGPFLDKVLTQYPCQSFKTGKPNLDIRHGGNFTGPKRGKKRTYHLEYWGDFKKIMENNHV